MKTFISGSKSIRVINDRILKELFAIIERGDEIIVGDCFGADVVVQDYLTASLYPNVIVYSRENKVRYNIGGWVVKHTAEPENVPYYELHRQRLALAKAIDNVLIIWDGKSEDELHKMKLFAEAGKPITLIYIPTNETVRLRSLNELDFFVLNKARQLRVDILDLREEWQELLVCAKERYIFDEVFDSEKFTCCVKDAQRYFFLGEECKTLTTCEEIETFGIIFAYSQIPVIHDSENSRLFQSSTLIAYKLANKIRNPRSSKSKRRRRITNEPI